MNVECREIYDRPPETPQICQWLLISHGKKYQEHTFFSITEGRYYTRSIPWLRNKIFLCDSYGWIVYQERKTKVCHIFNPISAKDIELPQLESIKFIKRVLLSKAPDHPDCHVFIIGVSEGEPGHFEFCKLDDKSFVKPEISLGGGLFSEIVVVREKVYGLMQDYSLVVLDVIGSTLQIKPLIKDDLPFQIYNPLPPENFNFSDHFIDSCDEEEVLFVHKVCSASYSRQVTRFRVFRLNLRDMIYEELKSIGNRVVFLDNFSGKVYSRPGPGFRINSIYYVEWKDNRLYVHNLEYQSRLLKLPCPNTRNDAIMSWWFMI